MTSCPAWFIGVQLKTIVLLFCRVWWLVLPALDRGPRLMKWLNAELRASNMPHSWVWCPWGDQLEYFSLILLGSLSEIQPSRFNFWVLTQVRQSVWYKITYAPTPRLRDRLARAGVCYTYLVFPRLHAMIRVINSMVSTCTYTRLTHGLTPCIYLSFGML